MRIAFKKIRTRFQVYSLALILLSGGLGLMFYVHSLRLDAYHEYQVLGEKTHLKYTLLHKAEQNFLSEDAQSQRFLKTGESPHLEQYTKEIKRLNEDLNQLNRNRLANRTEVKEDLKEIRLDLKNYRKHFIELSELARKLGNSEVGLKAQVQSNIEALQAIDSLNKISLLTLRKHEKDFLINKDLAYLDNLKLESRHLLDLTRMNINWEDSLSRQNMAKIVEGVQAYVHSMENLVQTERTIGLDSRTGLKARIAQDHQKLDQGLDRVNRVLKGQLRALAEQSRTLVWTIFMIALGISILLSIILSVVESAPLVALNRVSASLRKGLKNQEELLAAPQFQRRDEIGGIAQNIQFLVFRLRGLLGQVAEKDKKLAQVAEEEKLRSWHAEGMTLFGEIFRKNYSSLEEQSFEIISQLVKFTKSLQGGLFVCQENEEGQESLRLLACYAYDRKKYAEKEILPREGLVGTVWQEGKAMLISDIPEGYTHIRSTLGKAEAKSLLIVPTRSEEKVNGVIELVSFRTFQSHEIELIEQLALRIGNALVSIQAVESNRQLLANTEKIAQAAQEKEVRLKEQLSHYQNCLQEFEHRLIDAGEQNEIFQSILSKVYRGVVITDEKFRITMINEFILKRFNYQEEDLLQEPLEVLLETDYENILDLRDSPLSIDLENKAEQTEAMILDRRNKMQEVEIVSGKLELGDKIVYVFLLNEKGRSTQNTSPSNLKVAS